MLLEKFSVGQAFYAIVELESQGKDRAVIVPLTRDGDSLVSDVRTSDGRPIADVQPGDFISLLGLPERVVSIQLYEPAYEPA